MIEMAEIKLILAILACLYMSGFSVFPRICWRNPRPKWLAILLEGLAQMLLDFLAMIGSSRYSTTSLDQQITKSRLALFVLKITNGKELNSGEKFLRYGAVVSTVLFFTLLAIIVAINLFLEK